MNNIQKLEQKIIRKFKGDEILEDTIRLENIHSSLKGNVEKLKIFRETNRKDYKQKYSLSDKEVDYNIESVKSILYPELPGHDNNLYIGGCNSMRNGL